MARLIDADKLMEELKGITCTDKHDSMVIKQIIVNVVEKQPTAYDANKVEDALEEKAYSDYELKSVVDLEVAIEVVRKGGMG